MDPNQPRPTFYETPTHSDLELPLSPCASLTQLNGPLQDDTERGLSDTCEATANPDRHPCTPICRRALNITAPPTTQSSTSDSSGNSQTGGSFCWPLSAMNLEKFNPSLVLENSGSVARDHLAAERTFLAYVRTSLTIAAAGIALFQLFALTSTTTNDLIAKFSRPIGATVVGLGIVTLMLGVVRYFSVQSALTKGMYPVARVSPAFLAAMLLSVVFVVFGVLMGVRAHKP